ncbi:TPA: DUF350 domain-containing protein [Candidatus Poribacteria bacterium]|nr:DUF350 domain-containing protein [Candidatus Poribacteria bacterium]
MIDLLIGFIEILLSLLLGIITAWFAFKIFAKLTKDLDEINEIKKNNIAVAILLGSSIISVALVVRQAVYPPISNLQTAINKGLLFLDVLKISGVAILSVLITVLISLLAIWAAIQTFLKLTKNIDELTEIRRNNIAVAIVLGCLIIVIGLFLGQGIQSLLSALIPIPAFERIQIM